MKPIRILVVAFAVFLGGVGPASAARYVFQPAMTRFTISGDWYLIDSNGVGTCGTGTTLARTNKTGSKAKISKFAVVGFCENSTLIPWYIVVTGPNTANIVGMAFLAEGDMCGPSTVPVNISSTGVITIPDFEMAGNCTIGTGASDSLQTSPAITIVHK
jgi:hypothetical protein